MVAIVDRAVDEALERLDPQRRRERRLARKRARVNKQRDARATNEGTSDIGARQANSPRSERVPSEKSIPSTSEATASAQRGVSRLIPTATRENGKRPKARRISSATPACTRNQTNPPEPDRDVQ